MPNHSREIAEMLLSWLTEPPGRWVEDYFTNISEFPHMQLLKNTRYPWDAVKGISRYIFRWLEDCKEEATDRVDWGSLESGRGNNLLYVKECVCLDQVLFLKRQGIFIGKGTILEPAVVIKSPAIIENGCEIRHGAYLRGNTIIGDHTVIGHTTEVKNSVFISHAEAGHFSYIGDSIIGKYVNLGAGTKLANLEIRTLKEKRNREKRIIKVIFGREIIDTKMTKLGAIIGDGGELGCNSVTSPGVILGRNSTVYPTVNVKKGVYLPSSKIR